MRGEACGGDRIFGFCPGGDKGPQGGIGSEGPMVAVAVNARWGKDVGEAIQKLQGGEPEGGTSSGIGAREAVEDLVGAAADQVEAFVGEGRPGAIPDEAFEARAVRGLYADAPVKAEPTAVIPFEHVGGLVGL